MSDQTADLNEAIKASQGSQTEGPAEVIRGIEEEQNRRYTMQLGEQGEATRLALEATYQDTVTFYKTSPSDWRWRRVAANGRIVGGSTESYKNFQDCKANLERQAQPYVLDVE